MSSGRIFSFHAHMRSSVTRKSLIIAACVTFLSILSSHQLYAAGTADDEHMVVEAKELINNQDADTVTASGNVQIFYKGRALEADRVIYNRKTQQIFAEGNAKLTERDGSVVRAERFELTDDFKVGFINSLQYDALNDTQMSAPHAEMVGDTRVYDKGTYTACAACKDDPSKPRLWQVRAKRIIHNAKEKTVYYEDASMELLGVPIAYFPYLTQPDPTVKRRTGFLMPSVMYGSYLGTGYKVPFFWEISPDTDLTLTPSYYSNGIPYLTGVFRKQFENGNVMLRADGAYLDQKARDLFSPAPYGARNRAFRGVIQSVGEFDLNDRWKAGWNGAYFTDRYFMQDFGMYSTLNNMFFFRESQSKAYLTGQGPRSYFDMQAMYFQGLLPGDIQAQLPTTRPMIDYNRTFDVDPAKTGGIGGQLEVDSNFNSVSETLANYQSIQPTTLDSGGGPTGGKAYNLYNVCQTYSPNANPNLSQCLLRGVGGNYNRGAVSANWKRKFIDPTGGVWQPFAFTRMMGSYLDYNTTTTDNIYNAQNLPISNYNQNYFIPGQNNTFRGQVTPGAGVEYRYPLLAHSPLGDVVVEPIAQLIARPNQTSIPSLVNLDAQSLVFDDTNLFDWNKFSGYDRFETGTRINYGGQGTMNFANGGFINAMVGQSQQVAGNNAYAMADAANVGLASGLNTRTSDVVGRLTVAPASFFSLTSKGRFDKDTFDVRRIDLLASLNLNPVTLGIQYANYYQQPQIGFNYLRRGISTSARWDVTKNYFLNGSVTLDMSRGGPYEQYYNNPLGVYYNNFLSAAALNQPLPTLSFSTVTPKSSFYSSAIWGVGGGYTDECLTATLNYSSIYQPWYTGKNYNQTVYLSVNFRTLGEMKFQNNIGKLMNDGLSSAISSH